MITQRELLAILERLSPFRFCAWDFRRVGGRVVRFVRWGKGVRHA